MKYKEYFVWFSNADNIVVKVKQDENRAQEDDYYLVTKFIRNNYPVISYEIIELSDVETITI